MKKCIVISDSFKGSLSSGEICEIARESFQNVFPACKLVCIPVADGGEGTVACFQEVCGGELVTVRVQGPFGQSMEASYLQLEEKQAVIEMAAYAGLPLANDCKDPRITTTYGVGQSGAIPAFCWGWAAAPPTMAAAAALRRWASALRTERAGSLFPPAERWIKSPILTHGGRGGCCGM